MSPHTPEPQPAREGSVEPSFARRSRPGVQETVLSPAQFADLSELAYRRYGLSLPEKKRYMVSNRLIRLQREKGFANLEELLAHYHRSDARADSLALFDVLSTNLTHFFRESQHLEVMTEELLEHARATGERKLRIWSAGCSRGCEPFSIAISLLEALDDIARWDVRILATDLAISELEAARSGVFPRELTRNVDAGLLARHFEIDEGANTVRVSPAAGRLVTFAILNLLDPWRMKGPFDAIFCRNVMIYFDDATREKLIERFKALLRPGGLLFLGSSESLTGVHDELLRIHPSSYRKAA